ncbi:hypothetical protein D0T49_03825 [Paludibacter sp. 221]|nr:hypothetical protein [Paludibacter sp. 221]
MLMPERHDLHNRMQAKRSLRTINKAHDCLKDRTYSVQIQLLFKQNTDYKSAPAKKSGKMI